MNYLFTAGCFSEAPVAPLLLLVITHNNGFAGFGIIGEDQQKRNPTRAKSITSNQNCSRKVKKKLIIFSLVVTCLFGQAQKHDYNWMTGYFSSLGYDSNYQHWFGISKFDFNQQPVAITRDSLTISFDGSNSTISDVDGNMLFACNGIKVYNSFDEKIVDSMDGGSLYLRTMYPWAYSLGIGYPQYHIVLPNPTNNKLYDIFYVLVDSFHIPSGLLIEGTSMLRCQIDVSLNGNKGASTQKDVIVNPVNSSLTVSAVKHANGRDWWLCRKGSDNNCYYIDYYNGDTISSNSIVQCLGLPTARGYSGVLRFSPNGERLVMISETGTVNFFSFDRCTGLVNAVDQFIIPEIRDSVQWFPTVEFSPDGRFAYVFCVYRIFQYDIQATSIQSSRQTVGIFDPNHQVPFYQTFYNAQLAPDGKIYVSSGNSNYSLGIINNPNGQGASCNFNDTALNLPTFGSGVPYYPNYRLGALAGSPCDTISSLNETERAAKEKQVKVFPNPASDFVTVDYGFTDWSKQGEVSMEIVNELGQVVYAQPLPQYSGFQKMNIADFVGGFYTVYIRRGNLVIAASKFTKQ
ncbi:MAG: T9SS type A sorting domain-containing protein [Chitinophagales bacterium]